MARHKSTNQQAYDMYRSQIDQPGRQKPVTLFKPDDGRFLRQVVWNWGGGYRDLRDWINDAEPVARELLRARYLVRNSEFAGLPLIDIAPEQLAPGEAEMADGMVRGTSD